MSRARWRQLIIAVAMSVALTALAVGYFEAVVMPRRRIAVFDQFMAASNILGKSSAQIIASYGKPDFDTLIDPDLTLPKNHRVMSYDGPDWESCHIEFIDDKAAKAVCQGK